MSKNKYSNLLPILIREKALKLYYLKGAMSIYGNGMRGCTERSKNSHQRQIRGVNYIHNHMRALLL